MITALKTSRPAAVAIRFQPANDGDLLGASDLPMIAGIVRHEARRWPERASWQESVALPRAGASRIAARHEALLQELAVAEAERSWVHLDAGEVACRIHAFRDQYGLDSRASMEAWLRRAGLTFDQLSSFFRAEILVEKIDRLHAARVERELDLHRSLLAACAGLGRLLSGPDGDEIETFMGHDGDERALRRRILLRILSNRALAARGLEVDRSDVEAMSDRFRECFGLFQASEMMSWLTFSGQSHEGFTRQMREFTAVFTLDRALRDAISARMEIGRAVNTVAAWAER